MRKLIPVLAVMALLPGCGGIDIPCPPFCPAPAGVQHDCDNPPTVAEFYVPDGWSTGKVMIVLRQQADRSGALTLAPQEAVFDALLSEFAGLSGARKLLNVGMISANTDLETILRVVTSGSVQGVYAVQTHTVRPLDSQAVSSWGLDAIDARAGQDGEFAPRGTGDGVRIVINDTGVDRAHSDFEGRVSDDSHSAHPGTSPFFDGNGHGTHVAATAAGLRFGVAKKATIHACKSLGGDGSGTTDQVIECIDFGVGIFQKYGDPTVGNMSLGGPPDRPLNDALCRSHAAGVPWVVAAGNDGASACNSSPAQVKQALTVMASTRGDNLASFSSRGVCPDIIAPGQDITSAKPGGASQTLSGTSMACPHATGAVAICMQLLPNLGVGCLDEVVAWATEGRISGVPTESPDEFLYVGE